MSQSLQSLQSLQPNERDPYQFTKSSIVTVYVQAAQLSRRTTFHIHASLIRRYSSVLTQQLDNPWAPQILPSETDSFDSIGSESNNIITVRESQDTFRLFVGWLYQGSNALLSDPEYKSHPQRLTADLVALWSFAETFKIEALRNDLVDSAQRLPLNDNFFQLLISLDEWASATAQRRCGPIVDYMYDKLAYEITSKGWGHFMSVAGTAWTEMMHNPRTFKEITSKGWGHFMSVAGTAWTEMMHNPRTFKETTSRVLKRLVGHLSLAHELTIKGNPADPADRMDCRWHQHETLESFRLCPRYKEEDESDMWTRLSRNENNAQRQGQMEARQMIATWPRQLWLERQEEEEAQHETSQHWCCSRKVNKLNSRCGSPSHAKNELVRLSKKKAAIF